MKFVWIGDNIICTRTWVIINVDTSPCGIIRDIDRKTLDDMLDKIAAYEILGTGEISYAKIIESLDNNGIVVIFGKKFNIDNIDRIMEYMEVDPDKNLKVSTFEFGIHIRDGEKLATVMEIVDE